MLWSIFTGALLGISLACWLELRYRRMLRAHLEFLTDTYLDGHVSYLFQNGQWWRVRAWRLPMTGDEGEAVGDWPNPDPRQ